MKYGDNKAEVWVGVGRGDDGEGSGVECVQDGFEATGRIGEDEAFLECGDVIMAGVGDERGRGEVGGIGQGESVVEEMCEGIYVRGVCG